MTADFAGFSVFTFVSADSTDHFYQTFQKDFMYCIITYICDCFMINELLNVIVSQKPFS